MAEFIVTGSKDEYKAAEQTFSIYLNTPCFNMEAWSDGDFAKFKRDGNKITIYLSKNRHVAERLFGIVFSDPTGRYEQTEWSSVQSGHVYMFDSEESTFERGYTPEEYTVKQLQGPKLDRLYIGGELIKKPLAYTTEIKVYGGDCTAYIRGINKFRVLADNTAIPEQMVPFDSGIFAEIKPSESCQVDERGRTFNINTLTITSNGRPFSDNDEYFYVVSIGHSDTPRFYCEVRVEFKEKEGAGNATLDKDKLTFEYTGGTQIVNINLGNAEDCDWSVDRIEGNDGEEVDWLEVVRYPLSMGVVCQPITSLDDNQNPRTATIYLMVNGQSISFGVTQEIWKSNNVDVSPGSLVFEDNKYHYALTCGADDTEITLTVITYGVKPKDVQLPSGITLKEKKEAITNLIVVSTIVLELQINNQVDDRPYGEFQFETERGAKSYSINITQMGRGRKGSISFGDEGTDLYNIIVTKDNIPVVYASANWCIVELDGPTRSGEYDTYTVAYSIKADEENVFGVERKCKVVFTNSNETEKSVHCLLKNPRGFECTPSAS